VQGDVLTQWFERRDHRDLIIKMNTGSGKTLVGLLILQSCLNEGVGSAVYLAPDHLLEQVRQEAKDLGLQTTEDPRSRDYLRGQAILLANIHKLINGRSVFGVSDEGIKIGIGSIVVDDAHTCLATAEDQFTLVLPSTHQAYKSLRDLFESDLKAQSEISFADIVEGDGGKNLLVPYWAWHDKQDPVRSILHPIREEPELEWVWPLIAEYLQLCRCVFSGNGLEITPRCLPIEAIPSFAAAARRRVFLTAALADDGILVSDFDISPQSIERPISPRTAGDIGDRMILVPQELNPLISDDAMKDFLALQAQTTNVVVLVPSARRAGYWQSVAALTLTADNLADGLRQLRQGHVGLTVLVNKYDGVDLPNDACRILVLDQLPDVRKKIERVEQAALYSSEFAVARSIQRIEQGIGRGIRSNEDYCAVFLMGKSLTSTLYEGRAIDKFTPATRAQFLLSEQLSQQLRGQEMAAFAETISYCLKRDINWVRKSRAATVGAAYDAGRPANPIAVARRQAFNAAMRRDYQRAQATMQDIVNATTEPRLKGWLMQQLAEYQHPVDRTAAQATQMAAVYLNRSLTKPLDGIQYVRLDTPRRTQVEQCHAYLKETYAHPNDLILAVNGLTEGLVFEPDAAERFERSLAAVAPLIGFTGQRPEKDTGKGPDVIWLLGGLKFLVIECKNGRETPEVNKHDCNQLIGSFAWFTDMYDASCTATPVIIHPSETFERTGTPLANARVMNAETLPKFAAALREFAIAAAHKSGYGTANEIGKLLAASSLTPDLLLQKFTVAAKRGR
jgi:hypothetical protein